MATSNSDKVQEPSSNQYRTSASPGVVCFSEPEIMPENDKMKIKGAQHDGYHKAWKRKNALKRKKISDTGPSETARESFNNGGSFKKSNSNPELHQGGEGEGADEQQPRRRGVQFLQVPSNRRLVTRSAARISRIRPSPLVTSSLTCYSNMNEIDGDMELVPKLDFRQYHLDVDSDENDDDSSNEGEGKEVDEELEGQELEKLMNGLIVDPSSMPQNLPNIHHTKQISGVSLTGYQGDEEVLSEDDRWLSRPSDDAGMTRLHSQELLNELFFKFKYVRSSLKHHGRRRTFRKRVATESTRKISALNMIQKRNSDAIITNDHSLSEEEEDKEELEKKKEGEREKARRATMQADFSLYETKKKKKERKVLESIAGAGANLSPPQKKTRAQSVHESAGPTSITKYKSSSPDLSLLGRKKPPGSPKAPHFIKLKLHNPKSAEKLLKHLEMKKYDQVQRNERMDTPLHAIVRSDRKDKLECLLILMVFSDFGTENIDIPAAFGNTALHIAVQKGDLLMVRLLIVFGANIDAVNDRKRTPLDMLISGGNDKKFSKIIEELKIFDPKHGQEVVPVRRKKRHHFTRLMSISVDMPERQEKLTDHQQNQKFESMGMGIERRRALSIDGLSPAVIAQKLETNLNELYDEYDCIHNLDMQMAIGLQQFELHGWKKTSSSAIKFNVHGGSRILFLDGGGIRGLIQIEIMSIIEQRTGRTITELFDWIVGTSTGGIVALGLVYGKKTLAELRQFYFKLKDVFSSQSIGGLGGFNTEELEKILKEVLGTEMRMSDIKEPKVLISAVDKSTTNLQLNFFNNCFDDQFSNELVWKVARYTSAAPGYFSECDDYVDGGVLANNPCDYGLTAIQNFHRQKGKKLDIACVVSIGTGIFPAIKLGSIDAHKLFSVKAFGNLITLLSKALVESEDVAMNCKSRCEEQHIPFFRFCPHLDTEVASGETDNDKLIDMILQTKYQAVKEWNEKLEDLACIFSRIEEYSRKQMLQKLRDRRKLQTMISQNDVIPEEQ